MGKKGVRFTLEALASLSPDFKKANPDLFNSEKPSNNISQTKQSQIEIKTKKDTLNKTEARFLTKLEEEKKGTIIIQPTRFFELLGGGSYTPDFLDIHENGIDVWEVKGGYKGPGWEQGIERYKRAALQYNNNYITFRMAQWDRTKMTWTISNWK